jgi:predicted transcriptional regulator
MSNVSTFFHAYSPTLLEDETNLILLSNLVSGQAVSVNIDALSRLLRRHRNTVRKGVLELLQHKIINMPVCPFIGLYGEYPMFVVVQADLPDEGYIQEWIAKDKNIFAAYWSREAEYNTLLFLYHKDVLTYQLWRESLTDEGKIPSRERRFPSSSMYVSNQLMLKYDPSAAIGLLGMNIDQKNEIEINGLQIDRFLFDVLKELLGGNSFKINENLLSKQLNVHRKTVIRRVEQLTRESVILKPRCRFPDLLCPPNYILAYSLIEIRKARERVTSALQNDPHVSMALRISVGGYTTLVFSAHPDISEHMEWEKSYNKRFTECIGHAHITYLSPKNRILINQQKVSLGIIEEKIARARGKKLRELIKPT